MRLGKRAIDLTPKEFEEVVRRFLHVLGDELEAFDANQREKLESTDGTYEIDVTARFHALGFHFLVLIECKKQQRPVEREVVQILYDRIRAVGAHKGIVFSTGGFQSGAIRYAREHGIALVTVAPGDMIYKVKDLKSCTNIVAFRAGKFSLWDCTLDENDEETHRAIIERGDARRTLQLDANIAT